MDKRITVVPTWAAIAVITAVVAICLFLPPLELFHGIRDQLGYEIYQWNEWKRFLEGEKRQREWRRAREQAYEKRDRWLREPVRGHVSEAALDSAFLEVASIPYQFAGAGLWRYRDGRVLHRRCREDRYPSTDLDAGASMTGEERAVLLDVLNMIVKDGLFDQTDERDLYVVDGGELRFRFAIGNRHGQFRLVNAEPPHLEKFLFKVHELRQLTYSAHAASACPPEESWIRSAPSASHAPRPTVPVETEPAWDG
jgi:hypothetical protein